MTFLTFAGFIFWSVYPITAWKRLSTQDARAEDDSRYFNSFLLTTLISGFLNYLLTCLRYAWKRLAAVEQQIT